MALPIWNFILPIYSFWHFDDFSWGETRKVNREEKNSKMSKVLEEEENRNCALDKDAMTVQRKLWHVWEKERQLNKSLKKIKQTIDSPKEKIVTSPITQSMHYKR